MSIETPNLSKMGVRNPSEIVGYSLVQVSDEMDVLKINYGRPHNSFLPKWRSYEFKRSGKPMPGNELHGDEVVRFEISPLVAGAVEELDALLADSKRTKATKQEIQQEIDEIVKDFNQRLAHLSKTLELLD